MSHNPTPNPIVSLANDLKRKINNKKVGRKNYRVDKGNKDIGQYYGEEEEDRSVETREGYILIESSTPGNTSAVIPGPPTNTPTLFTNPHALSTPQVPSIESISLAHTSKLLGMQYQNTSRVELREYLCGKTNEGLTLPPSSSSLPSFHPNAQSTPAQPTTTPPSPFLLQPTCSTTPSSINPSITSSESPLLHKSPTPGAILSYTHLLSPNSNSNADSSSSSQNESSSLELSPTPSEFQSLIAETTPIWDETSKSYITMTQMNKLMEEVMREVESLSGVATKAGEEGEDEDEEGEEEEDVFTTCVDLSAAGGGVGCHDLGPMKIRPASRKRIPLAPNAFNTPTPIRMRIRSQSVVDRSGENMDAENTRPSGSRF